MTDIQKVSDYYDNFDEWSRLDTPAGQLEFMIAIDLLHGLLPTGSSVLDLGGGPGRYTIDLCSRGYQVFLADLSPNLIATAQRKIAAAGIEQNLIGADVVNAVDLSRFDSESFDVVVLFGPLYHLTAPTEISQCMTEVRRVLKRDGLLVASYLPRITGAVGILERSFYAPQQVDLATLQDAFKNGVFKNRTGHGFQEGAFIPSSAIAQLCDRYGLELSLHRSLRGIAYRQEELFLKSQEERPDYFRHLLDLVTETAGEPSIIETCGHALFAAKKR